MHLHILGICGTFMGGVAVLAREAGHTVGGSDRNVFPPMSTQLEALGIPLHQGYDAAALSPAPDVVVVGNVMSRGVEVVEHLLNEGLPYTSGPQWLARHVLPDRHVLAVAGTHGKTTTASMLAWILDYAGLEPGFLIGGVPLDFGVSARLGSSKYFVVEADEYDTAFFDKRSKFVHYRPRTLVMTNLEYDHADIFPDLVAICRQFHHLIRSVPGNGLIVARDGDANLDLVLSMGCWTPVQRYGFTAADWVAAEAVDTLQVQHGDQATEGLFAWPGEHYRLNALAALAAANHVGVEVALGVEALGRWRGVRRRLEQVGIAQGVTIYDDFAHHPTEIAATLQALREKTGNARLIAVFEPRSNSMKMGVHEKLLAASFADADAVYIYEPPGLDWDLAAAMQNVKIPLRRLSDIDDLMAEIIVATQPGDHVVIMSNGAFAGLPSRLYVALQES